MKIDNLSLSFRNKIVLEDINIEIKPGEFVLFDTLEVEKLVLLGQLFEILLLKDEM